MKLTRISDEEIRTQTRAPVVLEGHRRVAQAQLEACEKEAQEKVNREIIKWIEKYRAKASVFVTFDSGGVEDCVLLNVKDVKALKQKCLKEED